MGSPIQREVYHFRGARGIISTAPPKVVHRLYDESRGSGKYNIATLKEPGKLSFGKRREI